MRRNTRTNRLKLALEELEHTREELSEARTAKLVAENRVLHHGRTIEAIAGAAQAAMDCLAMGNVSAAQVMLSGVRMVWFDSLKERVSHGPGGINEHD